MRFLHYQVQAGPHAQIEVNLEGNAANVLLLDNMNFENYRRGIRYNYYGGHARHSVAILNPPYAGSWHVVVDLGGAPGTVKASVRVM